MTTERDIRRIEVIDDATARMFRAMTPGQRLRMGLRAPIAARRMIAAGVRHLNPSWSNDAVDSETSRRMSRAGH